DAKIQAEVNKAAQQLKAAGSRGLLVCGLDDKNAQKLVLGINQELQSQALLAGSVRYTRKGSDAQMSQLIADLKAGSVHTIIMSGVNPVYTLADGKGFADALKKAKLSVSFALREDETASVTTIAAAAPHFLESWGDVMLVKGLYSLSQPTIRPLFNTKQFEESLLNWNGNTTSYYDYLRANAASYLG